jgi:methyl-accepting chemotaxis protein
MDTVLRRLRIAPRLLLIPFTSSLAVAVTAVVGAPGGWIVAALGIVLPIAVTVAVARSISRPLRAVHRTVATLTGGAPHQRGRDEVADLGAVVDQFVGAVRDCLRGVDDRAQQLAASSGRLVVNAGALGQAAGESVVRASGAAATAEDIANQVAGVAAGTEQMGASIDDLADSVKDAAGIVTRATELAQSVTVTVSRLSDSSNTIGGMVAVIGGIAQQTNLLALNATIEAARAGEQGKGFAVVASEVKDLALETARATEDIASRITSTQTDITGVVTAIGQIADVIDRINELQASISVAVQQQSATTVYMGDTASEVAARSTGVATDVSSVSAATQAAVSGLANVQATADTLVALSADLRGLAGTFRS